MNATKEVPLFGRLPDGPIDVIGDVHGEIEPLRDLLKHLGYREDGSHDEGRTPVFIGDLTDRGPDSPAVVRLVRDLVERGRAHGVLGNHEINVLRADCKHGNEWAFELPQDRRKGPNRFSRDGEEACAFFRTLPIALENENLRLVHACWHAESIALLRGLTGPVELVETFDRYAQKVETELEERDWSREAKAASHAISAVIADRSHPMPMQPHIARAEERQQMGNPLKVVTSGVEQQGKKEPFFSSGKWRFLDRVAWWDDYADEIPVIVGHYWRWPAGVNRVEMGKEGPDLFDQIPQHAWLGPRKKVFCVDYGVGRRFMERGAGGPLGTNNKLGAMRWPEREIVFDDGSRMDTT